MCVCVCVKFRTEKQENYTNKGSAGVVRQTAPPSRVLDSAPFEGQSVFKSDFTGHRGAKPSPLMRPAPNTTVGGDEERNFESEVAANYRAHGQSSGILLQRVEKTACV
jgi:hypothetical protein